MEKITIEITKAQLKELASVLRRGEESTDVEVVKNRLVEYLKGEYNNIKYQEEISKISPAELTII